MEKELKQKKPDKLFKYKKLKGKSIPIETILAASVSRVEGEDLKTIAKDLGVRPRVLGDRMARVNDVMNSTSSVLSIEREIIAGAISDHLKPIKENLAVKSLEIIQKADELVLERLTSDPYSVKTKDAAAISEKYSGRFARLTGIEEDPTAGTPRDAKQANVFIQNIFNRVLKDGEKLDIVDGELVDQKA